MPNEQQEQKARDVSKLDARESSSLVGPLINIEEQEKEEEKLGGVTMGIFLVLN